MELEDQDDFEVEQQLTDEASALFKLCDENNKSYVTIDDLLALTSQLPLSQVMILHTSHSN